MGITIHYSGRAKSKAAIDRISHIAMLFAAEREWPCAVIDDPDGEMLRVADGGAIGSSIEEYDRPIHTTVVTPGQGCEAIRLQFGKDLWMHSFTKTQWGPIEFHPQICELLRAIEPYFDELQVVDESDFWTSGDLKLLDQKRQELFDACSELEAKLDAERARRRRERMYDPPNAPREPDPFD